MFQRDHSKYIQNKTLFFIWYFLDFLKILLSYNDLIVPQINTKSVHGCQPNSITKTNTKIVKTVKHQLGIKGNKNKKSFFHIIDI